MKRVILIILLASCVASPVLFAQFGIRAGINLANEIKSFSSEDISAGFSTENLTGYHIGLVYQAMPQKSGLGGDLGILLSQKGYTYNDSLSIANAVLQGYKEINYLEIPFNLRYRLKLAFLGIYGYGGLYTGYALNGKKVDETQNSTQEIGFQDFMNRVDFGYNIGVGVEFFRKIQFGATWSQGLKKLHTSGNKNEESINRVFSVNLTYLF
ncbi:MAG: outer membrane beta-barrel protein [Paludibacteraceae bacterium]|nr:outer membrane beta-barrel protein [Paludibacteraceae bacterium]